jgi:putative sterol carrier protein
LEINEATGAELAFFSREWWQAVTDAWNASGEHGSLASMGAVRFELSGSPASSVHIVWDESGKARLSQPPERSVPTFEATARDWRAFIAGEFTAVHGVMARKIHFRGRLRSILPYSSAFNRLAVVSQTVPTSFAEAE